MTNLKQKLISSYLAEIGRKGGKKSKRHLSREEARDMVRIREARRAFRKFHAQCFWYLKEDMVPGKEDIPEIVEGLKKNGGREGYQLAAKLCR